MKKLIFFLAQFCFLSVTWGLTEIIENSTNGGTHIDPVNNVARINIQSNFRNPNANISRTECKKIKIVRRETERGCVESMQVADPAQTCATLRTSVQGFVDCEELNASFLTVGEPLNCGNPAAACQTMATPMPYTQDIRLAGIREAVRTCSPEHELLVISDAQGKNAAISSLNDRQQCGRSFGGRPPSANQCASASQLRSMDTGSTLWDSENRPEYKINVSHSPGFYIGDHTHYYFDYAKQQWCVHFKPFQPVVNDEAGRKMIRGPVCGGLNGATRSIGFVYGTESRTKGVVKFEVVNGRPVATIGQPTSSEYTRTPTLDSTKPILRVTLSDESAAGKQATPGQGRSSTFELLNADGSRISQMTVSPTMSMGSLLNTAGSCAGSSENYCLNVPTAVSGTQSGERFCRNNSQNLPLSTAQQGLCYSCTGVTPGNCDQSTHLIQRTVGSTQTDSFHRIPTLYSDVQAQLNACYSGSTIAPSSVPTSGSEVQQ